MKFLKDKEVKKALYLGVLCMISYLACYFSRNILGVISPQMIETSRFSLEFIGTLSTANMLTYAFGQLINGRIGDIIKAKYMISLGLFFSGICNLIIPLTNSLLVITIAYAMSGFFLSTIYAPITKVVAENTLPIYATRCCLAYTFASFFGIPSAGIAAMFFDWDAVFILAAAILAIMGIICFIFFTIFEKNGTIVYKKTEKEQKHNSGIKILLKNSIVKFTFVSALTGIVRTSVVFWIPTYVSQYLGFSTETAAMIFTIITIVKSFSPYLNTLIIYERLFKKNMNISLLSFFASSAVFFLMMFIVKNPVINVFMLMLALVASGGASTMLWSVYCPSLRETGMVSTATGYLDFISYMAAAAANKLFANAITQIGWGNLILVWAALMTVGILISIPFKKTSKTINQSI